MQKWLLYYVYAGIKRCRKLAIFCGRVYWMLVAVTGLSDCLLPDGSGAIWVFKCNIANPQCPLQVFCAWEVNKSDKGNLYKLKEQL